MAARQRAGDPLRAWLVLAIVVGAIASMGMVSTCGAARPRPLPIDAGRADAAAPFHD